MMITLKPTHVTALHVFPSWVSNGHWAIRRTHIANAAQFSTREVIASSFPKLKEHDRRIVDSDDSVNRLISGDLLKWIVTPWRYYTPKHARTAAQDLVLLTSGDQVCFVTAAYCTLLQVSAGDVLYGKDPYSPLTDAEDPDARTWILMPVRNDAAVQWLNDWRARAAE